MQSDRAGPDDHSIRPRPTNYGAPARKLRGAPVPASRHVPNLIQEHSALHGIQLTRVRCQLAKKRICEDGLSLLLTTAAAIAEQVTDIDLESIGQALQRRQCRTRLAVLDL